ncbi:MAG: glycosyltransferase family 2 protein [Candidatus Omnitrophica bacterium]|nr:glycosyltransferase family 2 protein [Candidatus Omnitrophota bacterium]MDD5591754.1 glycosyltransferase family 2 protein [Candidatus Omnitrophota bacterium]
MKICVVIPTYNEVDHIAGLIKKIKEQALEVVVVDDGSSDNTCGIAQENGAIVLRNPDNEGKGASLIRGFNYVFDKGFDAVITMDGDGQHLPEEIPYFVRLAKYSDSSILIGNRMLKKKDMPLARIFTNKFMSWFISSLAGQKIPDTQCGFRLIKKEVLDKINLRTRKYETESEIIIKAARLGFKVESVPIKTIYRGEKSQINPIIDTLRFIKFISTELWITKS